MNSHGRNGARSYPTALVAIGLVAVCLSVVLVAIGAVVTGRTQPYAGTGGGADG